MDADKKQGVLIKLQLAYNRSLDELRIVGWRHVCSRRLVEYVRSASRGVIGMGSALQVRTHEPC